MAKLYKNTCVVCGKSFVTKSKSKETCKKECLKMLKEERRRENCQEQICWSCANCTGNCSWSKSLTPVDGWIAERSEVKEDDGYVLRTYKISACPKYILG